MDDLKVGQKLETRDPLEVWGKELSSKVRRKGGDVGGLGQMGKK